jgi:hypothetical protein
MMGIAVCAVWIAVFREYPLIACAIGPVTGSVWEVKKGGWGFLGAVIGGMITYMLLGIFFLIEVASRGSVRQLEPKALGFVLIIYAFYAIGGVAIAFAGSMAYCWLRALTTLAEQFRLRAERTAEANRNRLRLRAEWSAKANRNQPASGAG